MRLFLLPAAAILIAGSYLAAQTAPTPAPSAETPPPQSAESKGIPPRATPADYSAHAQTGTVTIAAEFMGHSVPTPEATLSTEEYVCVEIALFGSPDARLKLSIEDFSLRINGKKSPLASQPNGFVAKSLRDPEWSPPAPPEPKSKTGISGGGNGQNDTGSTPAPVHIPIELQRAMAQHVQKAALLEGDRPLPQAGLIFFQYRGKSQSIHSLELIYSGPAGNATLPLQP